MELHCFIDLLICPSATFAMGNSFMLQLSALQGPLTLRLANICCIKEIVCVQLNLETFVK
jgi:hypothetical protein